MAEEVSINAGTGRTYEKCEELHGLAIYFERTGKYGDALDVCKQILLEPAAYEQPEKELIVYIFQMCDYLCEKIDDEPQRRFFKKCENEYFKQILINRSEFIKAKSTKMEEKEEDCKLLAQICEHENPALAITYLLKHRKGKTEKETEEFNEQFRRLMARSGANRYEENFRQHSVFAGNQVGADEGVKRRAPKILKKRGKERARSINNVTFEIPQVSYSQEKSRRRKIKAALIVVWSLFVWFAVNTYPLPKNISHMLQEIKASLIAVGMLVIINWRNDWWPNLGSEEVFVTKMKTL